VKLVGGLVLTTLVLFVTALSIALSVIQLPQPNDFATKQATVFDYADGHTQIAHVGVNRISVPIEQIPQIMRDAILAAEDRSFYSESGVSPKGILRAVGNDLFGSGGVQGGSTITQQYVKNYYLTQKRTVSRKLIEALVAIKIDNEVPKDTILQDYLNTVYFARGSYGIETAARAYFGEPALGLAHDPAKAAYLAALVQSPYFYGTADTDPEAAQALRARWNYVLDGMVEEKSLSATERAGMVFPTTIPAKSDGLGGMNGYMVNAATQYLDKLHAADPAVPGSDEIARGGYTVVTTFQQDYMNAAQQTVTQELASLDPAHNPADQNVHIGLAAVDRTDGAVRGFYGGPDYLKQGFNDALRASGPVGTDVGTPLVEAVAAGQNGSWPDTAAALAKLGITDANPVNDPPASDDLATTPLHAAGVYMIAPNQGVYHEPYEVSKILYDGNVIWQAAPSSTTFTGSPGPGEPYTSPDGVHVTGRDGAGQWAWTVGSVKNMAIAVDLYATNPTGKGNRSLAGMTPSPGAQGSTSSAPSETRTSAIFRGFSNAVHLR
jgi:membrane peptidoglycan carboxypeptidase